MTFRVVPANTPTALSAQEMSSTQINLTWRDNATNETAYVVERSTSLDFTQNFTTFNLGANATTYSNTGLNADTVYFYRVRAVVGGANTTSTYWNHAKTLAQQAPVFPVVTFTSEIVSVVENVGTFELELTRTGSLTDGLTGFLLIGAQGDTAAFELDYYPGTNPEDFFFANNFLFSSGQSTTSVLFTVVNNAVQGPLTKFFTAAILPSEFEFTLGNPSQSTVTIVDGEGRWAKSG